MTRPSSLTVFRLAASGCRAVVGHAKDGLMGPRDLFPLLVGTSDPGMGRHVQATQDAN